MVVLIFKNVPFIYRLPLVGGAHTWKYNFLRLYTVKPLRQVIVQCTREITSTTKMFVVSRILIDYSSNVQNYSGWIKCGLTSVPLASPQDVAINQGNVILTKPFLFWISGQIVFIVDWGCFGAFKQDSNHFLQGHSQWEAREKQNISQFCSLIASVCSVMPTLYLHCLFIFLKVCSLDHTGRACVKQCCSRNNNLFVAKRKKCYFQGY